MKKYVWLVSILIATAVSFVVLSKFFPASAKTAGCLANTYVAKPIANLCLFQSLDRPLVNCRPSCLVNEARLQKKWTQGLPQWAVDQIKEDLSHYKKAQPSKFYPILKENGIVPGFVQLVQFQIKKGKVTVILPPIPDDLPNREVILEVAERQYSPISDILQFLAKKNTFKTPSFSLPSAI